MPHRTKSIIAELPEPETLDFAALVECWRAGDVGLFVVLGPTASGKTKFAVRLARSLADCGLPGAEIISADSRQVYRGMDIGTGKDLADYDGIPYHLIDIADPGEGYNVYRFREDFFRVYDDILSRGAVPILCGGTGLYINSVLNGYNFEEHIPLSSLRSGASVDGCLTSEAKRFGVTAPSVKHSINCEEAVGCLTSEAKRFGVTAPSVKHSINCKEAVGCLTSEAKKLGVTAPSVRHAASSLRPFVIGTLVSREVRNARIDARLKARLEEGMVDEIKGLLDSGVPAEVLIGYGLEYRFVTRFVLGEITYDEMFSGLSTAIHQFAKRQMTWFRGMERSGVRIHWVEV